MTKDKRLILDNDAITAYITLRNTFLFATLRHVREKQLKYLTDNDIMGDDEWIAHLTISWKGLFLSTQAN